MNALWTNKTIDRYLSIYLLSSDLLRKKIADAKKIRDVLRLFTRCCSSFSLLLRIVLKFEGEEKEIFLSARATKKVEICVLSVFLKETLSTN